MLPLKDDAPRITTPYVTYFLLAANILVFVLELLQQNHPGFLLNPDDPGTRRLFAEFALLPSNYSVMLLHGGVIPAKLVHAYNAYRISLPWTALVLPIVTSMFLHAGWWHLVSNMWALWIFGDNVEDHLGHGLYLLFYLWSGIAGALVHIAFNLDSTGVTIGASGAIAGVMAAYFMLFPSARVLTLVPFIFVFFLWIPAWLMIGYWFVVQILSGAAVTFAGKGEVSGVAFWAHVGGFLSGIALIKLFPARPRRYRYYGL